jgi:hypothetical protein
MTAVESAIKRGYEPEKYDRMLGAQYLLTVMIENYASESHEYQRKFGLGNDLRNQVSTLVRNSKSIVSIVGPVIGEQGAWSLVEDFEELREMIDTFLKL